MIELKIIWLHESGEQDPAVIGEEAACLSALCHRFPVPPGFCLVTGAAHGGELPAAASTGLVVAYNQLAKRSGQAAPLVTVIPSRAVQEAGEGGLSHRSLPVAGWEAVLSEVRRCFDSDLGEALRGVIIQQFIPADLTGSAFSLDPATGNPAEVLIRSTWGLGQGEDAGTPDRYRVAKAGLALLESRIGERRQMTVLLDGAAARVPVPSFLRFEPTLNGDGVQEAARMVIALERELQGPVAAEFAREGEELFLLGCRPLRPKRAALPHALEPMTGASFPPVMVPLPELPDFPVAWEQPEDADQCWILDSDHPGQALPMFASFCGPRASGLSRENRGSWEFRRINTFLYRREIPAPGGLEGEPLPLLTAGQLQTLWQGEILPEIQTQCLQLANTDLTAVPAHALRPQLDELVDRYILIWELHERIMWPVQAALEQYRETWGELFPDAAPAGQGCAAPASLSESMQKLLRGFDSKWEEARRELWRLSREVLSNPYMRALFAERPAREAAELLPATLAGEEWLRQLRAFLDRFGRRFEQGDWSRPSWREESAPALRMIQGFLAVSPHGPGEEAAWQAAERQRAEEALRSRLSGYPRPVRERFQGALRAAQAAMVLQEEHSFWIEHWSMDEVRRALLSLGRRFVADGMLDQPDEIWYLTLDEARAVAAGAREMSLRSRVAARREEMERWAGITPPARLGSCPSIPS